MSAPPKRVGVIGGGTMGTGIAYVFVAAGCEVTLVEPSAEQAAAAHRTIVSRAGGAAERGKLDRAAADRVPDLLRTVELVTGLDHGLDLIVAPAGTVVCDSPRSCEPTEEEHDGVLPQLR